MLKAQIKRMFRQRGFDIIPADTVPPALFDRLVESALRAPITDAGKRAFFVQIGANDGVSNDPLHAFIQKYRPQGILVEPQTDVFGQLVENYAGFEDLVFANIAIANQSGALPLYRIAPDFYPTYRALYKSQANPTGITSLNKSHVENFLLKVAKDYFADKDVADYVVADRVEALTFEDFIARYRVQAVDLLQIDTEGFDYAIIQMMLATPDFRPRLVNYEHKVLSLADQQACEARLIEQGYSIFRHGGDTCAFQRLTL